MIQFNISGIDEVVSTLRAIPLELRQRSVRTAMRKAANLVRDAAVANAQGIDDPETAERIAANIAVRFSGRRLRQSGDVMFRVGVLGGARQYGNTKGNRRQGRVGQTYATAGSKANPGGDTWYWRFQEFGTRRQPARPFLRPALANNLDAATNVAVTELNRALDRIARRRGPRR